MRNKTLLFCAFVLGDLLLIYLGHRKDARILKVIGLIFFVPIIFAFGCIIYNVLLS